MDKNAPNDGDSGQSGSDVDENVDADVDTKTPPVELHAPQVIGTRNFPGDSTTSSTGRPQGKTRFECTDPVPWLAVNDFETTYPGISGAALTPVRSTQNIAVSFTEAAFLDTGSVAQRPAIDQGYMDPSVQQTDPETRNLSLPVQESYDRNSDIDLRIPHDQQPCNFSSLGVSIKTSDRPGKLHRTQPGAQMRCARCFQRPVQCTNLPCGCRCYCVQCVGITTRCASCSCRINNFHV